MQRQDLEYVGFWPRLGAAIIDILLQLAVTLPLTYAVYGRVSAPSGKFFLGVSDFLINFFFPTVAVIAFWVYMGATPGKMAMPARIVDSETGALLSASRSVVRYLGYFVSIIPLGVGYLWIVFDRRKQGWHDKLANSVVVRPAGKEPVQFAQPRGFQANGLNQALERSPVAYPLKYISGCGNNPQCSSKAAINKRPMLPLLSRNG